MCYLKPCPKCDCERTDFACYGKDRDAAEMIVIQGLGGVEVQLNWMVYICLGCGFSCEAANTSEEARENWNRRAPQGAGLTEEQDESIRVAARTLDRLKSLVHISRLPAGAHTQSDINKGSIAAAKLRSVFPSVFAGN